MPSFQVDQFEAGQATGETVALRLDGRWIAGSPEGVSAPVLLVRSGAALERFDPAPGTELSLIATPAGEPWGATFPISAELLASEEAGFALEVAGGMAFALPDPSGKPPTATRGADYEFESLQEAVRELQLRLDAERRARRTAEDQLAQERLTRDQRQQEFEAAPPAIANGDSEQVRLLQTMVDELEERVRASGSAQEQLRQSEGDTERLNARLAEAIGRAATAEAELAEAREASDAVSAGAELEQRLSALEQSNADLARRAGDAEREAQTLKGALETTREAHAEALAATLAHEQLVAELRSGTTQAATTVRESRERLSQLEGRAADSEARAAELETQLAEARRSAQESAARAQELQARDDHLRQQAALADRRAEETSARLIELQAHGLDSREQLDAAAERAAQAEARLRETSGEIAALRIEADQESEARDDAQRQARELQDEVQMLVTRLQQAEILANDAAVEIDQAQRKLSRTDTQLQEAAADVAEPEPSELAEPEPADASPKRRSFRLQRKPKREVETQTDPEPDVVAEPQAPAEPEIVAVVEPVAESPAPDSEDAADTDMDKRRRTLGVLAFTLVAAAALLAAEANGVIHAWPLNP